MDSSGAQALADRFAESHPDRIEREREEDAYAVHCLEAHNALLAIQDRIRAERDE
jgi:hypothetical protein